nr:hypothetical protein [Candidatus Gracilibacteria bacterium]
MNIDYSRLSPIDFENLVRDISDTINKVLFPSETFSIGKDGGIDVRKTSDGKTTIIQAKHYKDWDNLWTVLKEEKEKVDKIKPDRYIVATSLELSKGNVDKIYNLFQPYIKSTDDIWWRSRLSNFIEKYPSILDRNMKLWLDSSIILKSIINSGNIEKNKTLQNDIENKIKLYVENEGLEKTIRILNKNNYCIISGIPGIGKTTLAEMVSYYFIEKGYKLFKITNDIDEAYNFLGHDDEKVIFYYDDFLGSNFLDYGLQTKNEDSNIIDFIKTLNRNPHKNKKLIFTTREYILKQALTKYNKFSESGLDNHKFIVNIKQYSLRDKMLILFNHLYFSSLPQNIKYDIVNEKLYKVLFIENKRTNQKGTIFEERFNPKILSMILLDDRIKKENYKNGKDFIEKLNLVLSNQNELYEDVFINKISETSQHLLLILFSYGGKCLIDILKDTWKEYQKIKNLPILDKDWFISLKELEGTFTITNKGEINFIDPFINDFFIYYLNDKLDILNELILLSKKWSQIEYLYSAFKGNKIFLSDKNILDVIEKKYFELEKDKAEKLLFICKSFPKLKQFTQEQTIILIASDEVYDLHNMLVLLMKYEIIGGIDYNEFIERYIDSFGRRYDISDIYFLVNNTNLNLIKLFFSKFGYDTKEIESTINSRIDYYYSKAEEIKGYIDRYDNDPKYIMDNFSKSYLDEDLNDLDLLCRFIGDNSTYDLLYHVAGEIESVYNDIEADYYHDDRKEDYYANKSEISGYDDLFSKLI